MTTPDPMTPPPAEQPAPEVPASDAPAPDVAASQPPLAPPTSAPPASSAPPSSTPPSSPPPSGPPPAGTGPGSPAPGPTAYGPTPSRPARTGPAPAGIVVGIILVVVGAIVLIGRVTDVALGASAWPLWLIVPGAAMVIASFAIPPRGGLGLAIPGAMLAMVGIVLWIQSAYNLYASWAYAWALVAPTAVGLGMLFYGMARGDGELVRDGLRTTATGIALFFGFALFFEGVIGLSGQRFPNVRENLPYLAIGLGVVLVVLSLFTGRRPKSV